jgi:predicted RNA-binding Zn-ribbon protein involved in translation (DUF1610 family)
MGNKLLRNVICAICGMSLHTDSDTDKTHCPYCGEVKYIEKEKRKKGSEKNSS